MPLFVSYLPYQIKSLMLPLSGLFLLSRQKRHFCLIFHPNVIGNIYFQSPASPPDSVCYRWTKKGGALPQGRTTYDNYGKTLVIKHVDFNDEGDYTCEASNGVGIAKSYSIQLKVYAQPYFTKEPESQTAAEGETVTFECEAEGYPAPQIKWVHNGKPIEQVIPFPVSPVSTVFSSRLPSTPGGP